MRAAHHTKPRRVSAQRRNSSLPRREAAAVVLPAAAATSVRVETDPIAELADAHLRRLVAMDRPIRGHGRECITRDCGDWNAPANDPGTLRQTCPCCGRDEYRGAFCSGCGIPTGQDDWYRPAQPAHFVGRGNPFAAGRESAPIPGDRAQDGSLGL